MSCCFPKRSTSKVEEQDISNMSSVKVYVDLRSQPCRALGIFLKLSKIPYELAHIDLFAGENKEGAFAEQFPLNTVPAICDGSFCLGETVAIFRYLTTKYAGKFDDHWYPKDLQARARVDEYIAFHHTGTRSKCLAVFVPEVLKPMFSGQPADKEQVEAEMATLKTSLDKIEKCFLKNNKFLCGNDVTIADIMAVTEFAQFIVNGRDILKDNPNLKSYMDRVKAKLGPAWDELHQKVYSWRDSTSK